MTENRKNDYNAKCKSTLTINILISFFVRNIGLWKPIYSLIILKQRVLVKFKYALMINDSTKIYTEEQ